MVKEIADNVPVQVDFNGSLYSLCTKAIDVFEQERGGPVNNIGRVELVKGNPLETRFGVSLRYRKRWNGNNLDEVTVDYSSPSPHPISQELLEEGLALFGSDQSVSGCIRSGSKYWDVNIFNFGSLFPQRYYVWTDREAASGAVTEEQSRRYQDALLKIFRLFPSESERKKLFDMRNHLHFKASQWLNLVKKESLLDLVDFARQEGLNYRIRSSGISTSSFSASEESEPLYTSVGGRVKQPYPLLFPRSLDEDRVKTLADFFTKHFQFPLVGTWHIEDAHSR